MTAPTFMRKTRVSNRSATRTDLRLAGLVVDVKVGDSAAEHDGSGALQNLLVTTVPSKAREEYLSEQGTWNGVHEKSACKGIPVQENSAVVLGDHVQVLRQGTVGDEATPLLYGI